MTTLQDVINHNRNWFKPENQKIFGDKEYWVKVSKQGKLYLLRSTVAWTDMFDGKLKLHYRLNVLDKDLSIGDLIDDVFMSMSQVNNYLKHN